MAAKSGRKAISINIGLNAVDPKHYQGWDGTLAACENDARDMAALAHAKGMSTRLLLTAKATRKALISGVRNAAQKLKKGDLFFLTYSGHGGQVRDVSGDEADKEDETWCLYDGEVIDDELHYELSRFASGVRILVLSDSCHSGTVTRAAPPLTDPARGNVRSRMMPIAVAQQVYQAHKDFYDKIQLGLKKRAGSTASLEPDAALAMVAVSSRRAALVKKFKPVLILISGCQDNQTSMDGERNGAFTEQLLHVWNKGAYQGNYARFHARIKARMPATQSPNLFVLGDAAVFVRQQPFSV